MRSVLPESAVCSVSWCSRRRSGHGLCAAHLKRVRNGHPAWQSPAEARFFSHVTEDALTGCWVWDHPDKATGYGMFRIECAHRWAYRLLIGPIPDGLQLDHLCRNRACVNPWHLDPVTPRVNNARSDSPTAINARRTECVHGHAFTSGNTYVTPDGRRQCRTCINIRTERHRSRSVLTGSGSFA